MKTRNVIFGAVLSAALAGCNTGPKAGDTGVKYSPNIDVMPDAPKDSQYTICCQVFSGPQHQTLANQAKTDLFANTKLDKWYVAHSADKSILYYGFYRTMDPRDPADAAEGKRALADLDAIREISDSRGIRPFSASVIVSKDTPDPAANPAWDLLRTKGYWSIEIAVYKNTPDRKELAVASVKSAREMGYEAYYYHGPTASSVCIGSWPREAAVERTAGERKPGDYRTMDIDDSDPTQTMVVSPTPLPESMKAPGVKTVTPEFQILDPTMTSAMRLFKEHAVDGQTKVRTVVDPRTGASREEVEQPLVVKVPERVDGTDTAMGDPGHPTGFPVNLPGMTGKSAIEDPTAGGLRSLDQK